MTDQFRNMTASEAKKLKVKEINLARVLEGFEMTNVTIWTDGKHNQQLFRQSKFDIQEQFVDLCIMLGCDYCGSIRGVGQKKVRKKRRTAKTDLQWIHIRRTNSSRSTVRSRQSWRISILPYVPLPFVHYRIIFYKIMF